MFIILTLRALSAWEWLRTWSWIAQIPVRSVMMEIVVFDIPMRFGIILSRSWGSNIGVSIKLYLTYAPIPIFGGEEGRLYMESVFIKIITRVDFPNNSHVYVTGRDITYFMLDEDCFILEETHVQNVVKLDQQLKYCSKVWKLHFDGVNYKEGNGVGSLLISLERILIPLSLKLEIKATNNVAGYEVF